MASWPLASSPFHPAELELQRQAGVVDAIDRQGRGMIRTFLPVQQMEFYPRLQLLYVGSLDASGQPWASVLCAPDDKPGAGGATAAAVGFVQCPDPKTLVVGAGTVATDDPLHGNLAPGSPLGLLGLEHHSRRRNRANGRVVVGGSSSGPEAGFRVAVQQSFGNCPQYINARSFRREPAPFTPPDALQALQQGPLSDAATQLIHASDTHFIASACPGDSSDPTAGCDISHRGGRPGFVRVAPAEGGGSRLDIPDWSGNKHFNTLGNIAAEPRVGLLFVDWRSGDVLHVAGIAAVERGGPRVAAFPGAERLLSVSVTTWRLRKGALALREDTSVPVAMSPFLAATATWDMAEAATALAAAKTAAGAGADGSAALWLPFLVSSVTDESATVKSFVFVPEGGSGVPLHVPGQHLRLRLPSLTDTERSYTISSQPNGRSLTISVRRQGAASVHLHDCCPPGSHVLLRSVAGGRFVLDRASPRPPVLLSAGIGVTPMLAMLEGASLPGNEKVAASPLRELAWVHVARSGAEHPFRERVRSLLQAVGHVAPRVYYTQPLDGDVLGRDYDVSGRLKGSDLLELFGGTSGVCERDW